MSQGAYGLGRKTPKGELYEFYQRSKSERKPFFDTTGNPPGPFATTVTLPEIPGVLPETSFSADARLGRKREIEQEAARLAVGWLREKNFVTGDSLDTFPCSTRRHAPEITSPKSELNEFYQRHTVNKEMPKYVVEPTPDGRFMATCTIPEVTAKFEGPQVFESVGKSKRAAEQSSARAAIEYLKDLKLVNGMSLIAPDGWPQGGVFDGQRVPPLTPDMLAHAVYVPNLGYLIPEHVITGADAPAPNAAGIMETDSGPPTTSAPQGVPMAGEGGAVPMEEMHGVRLDRLGAA